MSLDEYINLLKQAETDIPRLVNEFVEANSKYLVGNAKLRFFNYGRDGSGALIGGGKYAPRTIENKKDKGQRTSHITLKDTGRWWDSLFATYENGTLVLASTDKLLTAKLVDGDGKFFAGYGENIMEFTRDELDMFEDDIFKKLIEYLNNKFNQTVTYTV